MVLPCNLIDAHPRVANFASRYMGSATLSIGIKLSSLKTEMTPKAQGLNNI